MPVRQHRTQVGWRGGFLAATVSLAFAVVVAASALAAAPVRLDTVILTGKRVGPGYVRTTIPGGRQVQGQVTLDFCGGGYASEALRSRRFQAVYAKKGSGVVLSNEVVRYEPGGAKQAIAEVSKHVKACPSTPVPSGSAADVTEKYLSIDLIRDPKLLAGSIAIRATIEYTYKGKKQRASLIAIYQRHGDYLSGLYVYGGPSAGRLALALRAARASGDNLLLTDHLTA